MVSARLFSRLTTTAAAVLLAGTAHANGGGHGIATRYPDARALGDGTPYADGAGATLPVGGFGRLFALHAPLDSADPSVGTLRPHPSPRHDLVRLGRAMFDETPDDSDGEMPVGYVFLGQFIDHDLTLDVVSGFNQLARSDEFANTRTVDLDLDCVYGDGPEATPHLYNLPYLRVGAPLVQRGGDTVRWDLLRVTPLAGADATSGAATALIGDPRNDENFAVAQMQAAFVAFHNRIVDRLLDHEHAGRSAAELAPTERLEVFEEARDHVVHFYHRMIMEDFLPRIIGIERVRQMVVTGRDFYFPNGFLTADGRTLEPFIPIEFSVAGYRFGHSQVRNAYTLRAEGEQPVRAALFPDPTSDPDLIMPRGFTPIREGKDNLVFEWHRFVDVGAPWDQVQRAQKIDPTLENVLSRLEQAGVVPSDAEGNLASRNLNRGRTFQLPSGQDLAVKVLTKLAEKGVLQRVYAPGGGVATCLDAPAAIRPYCLAADTTTSEVLGLEATPLWYYILQEASVFGCPAAGCDPDGAGVTAAQTRGLTFKVGMQDDRNGFVLGPVGSAIVGETLYGLVDHYRETTGKGLDYTPALAARDVETDLIPFDAHLDDVAAAAAASSGTTETLVDIDGERFGRRYMLRNFIIDAGLHEHFALPGTVVCDGSLATAPSDACQS